MSIVDAYPFTLTNGTTANADQVMADLDQVRDDVNARAAAGGANDDITALLGLTTPISVAQGGTGAATEAAARAALGLGAAAVEGLDDNVVDSGGNLHATTTQHSALISGSGSFAIPANATAASVFKFTVFGGGGGGGGATTNPNGGGGGGSGGGVTAYYRGFTPSTNVAVVIGGAGAAGSGGGGTSGGDGGDTTLTYAAVVIATANGGKGGGVNGQSAGGGQAGAAGAFSASAGASGLTLDTALGCGAQNGGEKNGPGGSTIASGAGGSNPYGRGGIPRYATTGTGTAGTLGAGGSGGLDVGAAADGGAGGAGFVLVEWVL